MTFHIINNYCYFLEKNEYKTSVNSDSYFIIVLKKHIVAFPAHFLNASSGRRDSNSSPEIFRWFLFIVPLAEVTGFVGTSAVGEAVNAPLFDIL